MSKNVKSVLILAAGEAKPRRLLAALARGSNWIIAADGGVRLAQKARLPVDQFVGDGDSISRRQRCWLEAAPFFVAWHAVEKDETDLELALNLALEQNPCEINIFAAWGLRADHTLSNVHLLERAAESGVKTTLWAGWERLQVYLPGVHTLTNVFPGQRVSLLPLSETVERVVSKGLRYPLCDETLFRVGGRGISNEVVSMPVCVQFAKGVLLGLQAYDRRRIRDGLFTPR